MQMRATFHARKCVSQICCVLSAQIACEDAPTEASDLCTTERARSCVIRLPIASVLFLALSDRPLPRAGSLMNALALVRSFSQGCKNNCQIALLAGGQARARKCAITCNAQLEPSDGCRSSSSLCYRVQTSYLLRVCVCDNHFWLLFALADAAASE